MNSYVRSFLILFVVVFAAMYFRMMNSSNYTMLSVVTGLGIIGASYYKSHRISKSTLMSGFMAAVGVYISYNIVKHIMANYLYIYV